MQRSVWKTGSDALPFTASPVEPERSRREVSRMDAQTLDRLIDERLEYLTKRDQRRVVWLASIAIVLAVLSLILSLMQGVPT